MTRNISDALSLFTIASFHISQAGLESELERQRNADFEEFSESDLLRESAWVILCSGFRESVVKRHFNHISLCFCDWCAASDIVESALACKLTASSVFANAAKLDAIVDVADQIFQAGFPVIRQSIIANPLDSLQRFSFIGPVTALHLAKNLGLNVAKPDRHLVRVANCFGFDSASQLCLAISNAVGETTRIVDYILWRYLADSHIPWKTNLSLASFLELSNRPRQTKMPLPAS